MYKLKQTAGYSLVEVLVSIAVLLIAIVGPMTIAAQGIKSSRFALEQNTAFFLAQEGIEAIVGIRYDAALTEIDGGADAWAWLDSLEAGPCSSNPLNNTGDSCTFGVDFADDNILSGMVDCNNGSDNCRLYRYQSADRGTYRHSTAQGSASQYTREVTVTVSNASIDTVEVRSVVTWESQVFRGQTQSIELVSQLFNILI